MEWVSCWTSAGWGQGGRLGTDVTVIGDVQKIQFGFIWVTWVGWIIKGNHCKLGWIFLSGITSPSVWILKMKPGRLGFCIHTISKKKKKIQQHQKCLGCFCGFSGRMRLGLWTFVSCCTLQWAGAVVYPWFGADMTFVANGLIQLKWWRHLTLSSCTVSGGLVTWKRGC